MATSWTISDYTLSHRAILGRGSFGFVYKGEHKDNKMAVAMKQMVYVDGGNVRTDFRKIGEMELDIYCKLGTHKNIVQFLDHFDDGSSIWYIMEYCDGGDLCQYLKDNVSITICDKANVMIDCANGLAYMHSHQPPVVHQNIKPLNVLLKKEGASVVAKLTDYGVAKLFESTFSTSMKNFAEIATYKAPEFFQNDGDDHDQSLKYTTANDIFALGLLFHGLYYYDKNTKKFEDNVVSVTNVKTTIPIYFGWELNVAVKNGESTPRLYTPRSEPQDHLIDSLISDMIKYKPSERIQLNDVKHCLKEIYGEAIWQEVRILKEECLAVKQERDEVQTSLQETNTKLEECQKQDTQAKSMIEREKAEHMKTKDDFQSATSKIAALVEERDALQTSLESAEEHLETVHSQYSDIQRQLGELQRNDDPESEEHVHQQIKQNIQLLNETKGDTIEKLKDKNNRLKNELIKCQRERDNAVSEKVVAIQLKEVLENEMISATEAVNKAKYIAEKAERDKQEALGEKNKAIQESTEMMLLIKQKNEALENLERSENFINNEKAATSETLHKLEIAEEEIQKINEEIRVAEQKEKDAWFNTYENMHQRKEAVDEMNKAIAERNKAVLERENAESQQEKNLQELNKATAERDEAVFGRENAESLKDQSLKEQESLDNERRNSIQKMDKAVMEKNDAIVAKEEAILVRDECLKEKNQAIQEKQQAIQRYNAAIIQQNIAVTEKDTAIREKYEAVEEKSKALKQKEEAILLFGFVIISIIIILSVIGMWMKEKGFITIT